MNNHALFHVLTSFRYGNSPSGSRGIKTTGFPRRQAAERICQHEVPGNTRNGIVRNKGIWTTDFGSLPLARQNISVPHLSPLFRWKQNTERSHRKLSELMKGGTHMPRFRALKNTVRNWIHREDWSADQPLPPDISPDAAPGKQADGSGFAYRPPLCLSSGGFSLYGESRRRAGRRFARSAAGKTGRGKKRHQTFHVAYERRIRQYRMGHPRSLRRSSGATRPLPTTFIACCSLTSGTEKETTHGATSPLRLPLPRCGTCRHCLAGLKHEGLCVLHEAQNDPDPACRELARDMFERLRPGAGRNGTPYSRLTAACSPLPRLHRPGGNNVRIVPAGRSGYYSA